MLQSFLLILPDPKSSCYLAIFVITTSSLENLDEHGLLPIVVSPLPYQQRVNQCTLLWTGCSSWLLQVINDVLIVDHFPTIDHRRLAWDHRRPWHHVLWAPLTYPWRERAKPLEGGEMEAHFVVMCLMYFCVLCCDVLLANRLVES